MSLKEFMEAEKKAKEKLNIKGIMDPRISLSLIKSSDYLKIKNYDQMLANEIINILRTSSGSSPENTDNSTRSSRTQSKQLNDWATSAYDR